MTREDIKYCLLLITSSILAYFQLSFFIFTTKWDNLSAFFAYKYTASEWWLSGNIPLWDPFQNLGYPMHANPQGYVWYPITWLLNLPNGYSLYSLNIETVLHVAIASVGMYFLAKWASMKPSISFLAGLTYGLCGFVIASNHMIGFTIGAAWLPWCILFLLKVLKQSSVKNIIGLSIVCYLQITGAYIAFTIVLCYLFLFLVVQHLALNWKNKAALKQKSIGLIISLSLTLVLSSPYLYSIYDSIDYFSRAQALTYENSHYLGNFNWNSFQSLFAPFINSSAAGFRGVDVSLSNIYIGIIPLLLLCLSIVYAKFRNKKTIVLGLAISLLLALGIHTPIHQLSCQLIPGFNLFRHPYLFTLYFTFGAIILSFKYLNNITTKSLKQVQQGIIIGSSVLLIFWIIYFIQADKTQFSLVVSELSTLPEKTSFSNAIHGTIQLSIAIILMLVFYFIATNLQRLQKFLPLLLFLDLFVAIQLNGPTNMYYNVAFNQIESNLKKLSNSTLTNQSYATPLVELENDKIKAEAGFWVNLNTYNRTTGIDGYNPFVMSSFEALKKSDKYDSLIHQGIIHTKNLAVQLSNFSVGYNTFKITSTSTENSRIYLNQNFHHNWKVLIDHTKSELQQTKIGLMSVNVPKGIHAIEFRYSSQWISMLFFISSGTLLILGSILILQIRRSK